MSHLLLRFRTTTGLQSCEITNASLSYDLFTNYTNIQDTPSVTILRLYPYRLGLADPGTLARAVFERFHSRIRHTRFLQPQFTLRNFVPVDAWLSWLLVKFFGRFQGTCPGAPVSGLPSDGWESSGV